MQNQSDVSIIVFLPWIFTKKTKRDSQDIYLDIYVENPF